MPSKRYILTELAASDLIEIKDFIAQDNINASRKVLSEIREAMRIIASNPNIGHSREELSNEAKFWLVRSYLIVYLPNDPVTIVRVLHGARDFDQLL